jgi:ribosomal protein S18 acetylase RimI-like enzyme
MTPYQATEPFDWPALRALIARAFAGMEGRIDPPSSLHRLTPTDLARQAVEGEIWVIGSPPLACMVLTPKADALYLGKLAVEPAQQGRRHGRTLLALAEDRARTLGFQVLELETRVELVENQRFFTGLGFQEVARKAHPGFDRPTSITYRKSL